MIEQTGLEDIRLSSIHDYESHIEKTWKDYGVDPVCLHQPMTTTVWKTVLVGPRHKQHYVQVEKPLDTNLQSVIEKYLTSLLLAANDAELSEVLHKAKSAVLSIALYLWSRGQADGPEGSSLLLRKAQKAEYLAEYHKRKGNDGYAATQHERAYLLRRKAAGDDVILPKRSEGVTHKARQLYAEMEKSGPKSRAELITAAVAAGIHPGTCAVQYAQYRREQKSK